MEIGLFFNLPHKMCGCWKVIDNTIRGLTLLGHTVSENQLSDVNGVLQIEPLQKMDFPFNTLIGPEIMVLPNEHPNLWAKYKNWVQPAQWVINYMHQFKEINGCNLWTWPVGIDTDKFHVERGEDFAYDCFVYYKNVTKQTELDKLDAVIKYLEQSGMKFIVLKYGEYDEAQKKMAAINCRFGIYLAGTESQGIALMEFLSMDVPMYVLDEVQFKYSGFTYSDNTVSSAPYFDVDCGIKIRGFNLSYIPQMLKRKFTPREWILNHHTLQDGAKRYVEILRTAHGR